MADMSAKEKAQELVDKFISVPLLDSYEAKQCALVAVDEILEHCYQVMKPFWLEVKQEIEIL